MRSFIFAWHSYDSDRSCPPAESRGAACGQVHFVLVADESAGGIETPPGGRGGAGQSTSPPRSFLRRIDLLLSARERSAAYLSPRRRGGDRPAPGKARHR